MQTGEMPVDLGSWSGECRAEGAAVTGSGAQMAATGTCRWWSPRRRGRRMAETRAMTTGPRGCRGHGVGPTKSCNDGMRAGMCSVRTDRATRGVGTSYRTGRVCVPLHKRTRTGRRVKLAAAPGSAMQRARDASAAKVLPWSAASTTSREVNARPSPSSIVPRMLSRTSARRRKRAVQLSDRGGPRGAGSLTGRRDWREAPRITRHRALVLLRDKTPLR